MGRNMGKKGAICCNTEMPPSVLICYLPYYLLRRVSGGMVVCPDAQPGGSPLSWKLAGGLGGSTIHIPTDVFHNTSVH